MAETKKIAAVKPAEKVEPTVKAEVAARPTAAVAVKPEKKEEVKAEVKAPVKKTPAKKTAAKTTVAKTTAKAAKTPAKKSSAKQIINLQFAGKSYSTEDLVKIAGDVWKHDLHKSNEAYQSLELYVKPEESIAYYVFNGDVTGSFFI